MVIRTYTGTRTSLNGFKPFPSPVTVTYDVEMLDKHEKAPDDEVTDALIRMAVNQRRRLKAQNKAVREEAYRRGYTTKRARG